MKKIYVVTTPLEKVRKHVYYSARNTSGGRDQGPAAIDGSREKKKGRRRRRRSSKKKIKKGAAAREAVSCYRESFLYGNQGCALNIHGILHASSGLPVPIISG